MGVKNWREEPWLAWDLETTGPNPATARICQIGITVFDPKSGSVIKKSSRLVNPGIPIPPEATAINRITNSMVVNAMPEEEACARLLDVLSKESNPPVILTYNGARYDENVLKRVVGHRIDRLNTKLRIDVFQVVRLRGVGGSWGYGGGTHKLGAVAERLGIQMDKSCLHEATADCEVTARVFHKIAQDFPGDVDLFVDTLNCDSLVRMKALSIQQPWADLIVTGQKDIENRRWNTDHRGPFLVHAPRTFDHDSHFRLCETKELPPPESYKLGGIVGIANLVSVERDYASPWFIGPYGFLVRDAKPIRFFACRGELDFFDVLIPSSHLEPEPDFPF